MKQPKLKIGDKYRVIKTNKIITVEEIFNRHSFYGSDNNWHNLELGELQLIKPKTKWKNTRKQLYSNIKKLLILMPNITGDDALPIIWSHINQIKIDLLAKQSQPEEQEDKKEPKGFSVKQLIDFAKDINDRHLLDTPSPLDSIEEIIPILSKDRLSCYNSKKEIVSKINEIINYLKGKK